MPEIYLHPPCQMSHCFSFTIFPLMFKKPPKTNSTPMQKIPLRKSTVFLKYCYFLSLHVKSRQNTSDVSHESFHLLPRKYSEGQRGYFMYVKAGQMEILASKLFFWQSLWTLLVLRADRTALKKSYPVKWYVGVHKFAMFCIIFQICHRAI